MDNTSTLLINYTGKTFKGTTPWLSGSTETSVVHEEHIGDFRYPVILFAYARPTHLRQTLDCLHENQCVLIYAFSDGPRSPEKASAVAQVRDMLRSIDWCRVVLCERETNLGLGRSILTGVTEVLDKHQAAIIFEDDLVCVPGTYDYLCDASEHFRETFPRL